MVRFWPKEISFKTVLPWILIIGGVIGFICAVIITDDKMHLLADSSFRPNCDLNPVISCGSVMQSKQSNAFGFSNPYIGLMAFPVLFTIGTAMLAGGVFKRWFWLGLQAGTILGLLFVHWLFFESVYRIGALCPYCMVVWVITITTFWYVLLYNLNQGHIKAGKKLSSLAKFISKHHLDILLAWFLVITALILQHFWYYYGQYFK